MKNKCPFCNNEREVVQDWCGIIGWGLLLLTNLMWWLT